MKPPTSVLQYGLILLLAISFTVVSRKFIRPQDCQTFCDAPEDLPCPSGSCRAGEQRAGFPLPMVIDTGTGSSPTGGWGKLGPEDLPNPLTPVLDVLFYSVLLWLVWYMIRVILGKEQLRPGNRQEVVMVAFPLAFLMVCLILGLYLYWPILVR